MLKKLTLQNFVIAESLTLHFQNGLCVLTGETGAGKSLIMDAILGVLGQRLTPDVIRQGAEFAYLELVFAPTPRVRELLAQRAYPELLQAETLVVSKTIHPTGSRSRLNGQLVTQGLIRELASCLLDSIGQSENQALYQEERHLGMLDELGSPEHQALLTQVSQTFHTLQLAQRELNLAQHASQEQARQEDFLRFQLQEIQDAELEPEEEATLQSEKERLRHANKLLEHIGSAYQGLYESSEGEAVCERLETVQRVLGLASRYDQSLQPIIDQLESALIGLQDAAQSLSRYQEELVCDPQRLLEVEARLDLISRLKHKYGPDMASILAFAEQVATALSQYEQSAERLAQLSLQVASLQQHYASQAEALSRSRQRLATALEPRLERELQELGMAKSRFQVELNTDPERLQARGREQVRFLLSTNPGEPLRPLARIASGGEASRLLLAFKLVLKQTHPVPCLIFDEIDAGISGKAALVVSQKLARLAQQHQILCISHLPVIAAMADQQLWLEKRTLQQQTQVRVRSLKTEERVACLAQMSSGLVTDSGLEGAREIFAHAQGFKHSLNPVLAQAS